jgi:hypothetical protein
MEGTWRVFRRGAFHDDVQCRVEWIVFLHRASGGFDAARQAEVHRLVGTTLRDASRLNPQVVRESLRLLASLERLPATARIDVGNLLVERLAAEPGNGSYLWALGRVGARFPVYGPEECVVAADTASVWIESLLRLEGQTTEANSALVGMTALTGDARRDVRADLREAVAARLRAAGRPEAQIAALFRVIPPDIASVAAALGESIPEGLRVLR